jgi:hypothetical protein
MGFLFSDLIEGFSFSDLIGGPRNDSTSNITNNTTTNNLTNYNNLQKSTTNVAVESIMTAAATCSGSISQTQEISGGNVVANGPNSRIGISQNQSANLNFSCVQMSKIENTMQTNMVNTIMQELQNNFSAEAKAQMNAAAQATQSNGALSTSFGSSNSSNSNVTNNTTTNNTLNTNVQNIVSNNVSQNMKTSNLQECITAVTQRQKMSYADIIALNGGNIDLSQNQDVKTITECKQMNQMSNGIATGIFAELGISLQNDAKTSSTTEASAISLSEQKNEGIITALGGAISGIIGSIGSVFGNIFGQFTGAIVLCILLCLCCCLSLCAMMFMGGSGNTSSEPTQEGGFIGKTLYNTGLFDTDYISTMYMLSSTPN